MICKKCGKEISDDSKFCNYCGKSLSIKEKADSSKHIVGILLAIFLGLIGGLIGICIYGKGTVARKTFVTAWVTTYELRDVMIIMVIGICCIAGLIF